MKDFVVNSWDAVMDSSNNPLRHLDLASQHYVMQVLGWMWSMVFSLTFLSIYHFGITWAAHLLLTAGVCMTVAAFKQSEKSRTKLSPQHSFSSSSVCVWKIDTEA